MSWDMHPMWWMWGAGGIVMMLGMLLFWVTVIVAVVLGARWVFRHAPGAPLREDSAIQILRERYARGEISQQEFEERRRHLS